MLRLVLAGFVVLVCVGLIQVNGTNHTHTNTTSISISTTMMPGNYTPEPSASPTTMKMSPTTMKPATDGAVTIKTVAGVVVSIFVFVLV